MYKDMEKRVAVIGAGVSGLAAIKTCLEAGFKPVCFEKKSVFGGVWVYDDDHGRGEASSMYDGLVTNTSKEMMCFSDFPFPKEYPPYLLIHHVIKYLRDYAKHYDLEKYIRFGTEVIKVTPVECENESTRWKVTSRDGQDDDVNTEDYNAVMICTGCHSKIKMPKYPGMDEFKGQIIHSNAFRNGEEFKTKTVLVIGASHSAGDVATQCSYYTDTTYISFRTGCYVLSRRGPKGQPADSAGNRRIVSIIPEFILAKIILREIESKVDLDSLGLRSIKGFFNESKMMSDTLPDRILNGTLKVKARIENFTESGCTFVDGTVIENIDTVVCATGYHTTFPFLDQDILNGERLELYKHVLSPKYKTLAFIGAVGILGAAIPAFELQARWTLQVFSGSLQIPDLDARTQDAKSRIEALIKRYGHLKMSLFPLQYQEELAGDINAKPTMMLFLTDPKLAIKVFFGPTYPPSYRLRGPHTWVGARDAIMNGWENTTRPTKTRQVETSGY